MRRWKVDPSAGYPEPACGHPRTGLAPVVSAIEEEVVAYICGVCSEQLEPTGDLAHPAPAPVPPPQAKLTMVVAVLDVLLTGLLAGIDILLAGLAAAPIFLASLFLLAYLWFGTDPAIVVGTAIQNLVDGFAAGMESTHP